MTRLDMREAGTHLSRYIAQLNGRRDHLTIAWCSSWSGLCAASRNSMKPTTPPTSSLSDGW